MLTERAVAVVSSLASCDMLNALRNPINLWGSDEEGSQNGHAINRTILG